MGNTYKHNILPITIFIKLVVYVHWTSEKCIHVYYILSLFGAHTLSFYICIYDNVPSVMTKRYINYT